jgi:hypothetical protein
MTLESPLSALTRHGECLVTLPWLVAMVRDNTSVQIAITAAIAAPAMLL